MNTTRLNDAARAGWLYYIAGKTQDEIAAAMGISRQAAQRLVSLAVSERLVKVWLDHPIAECMDLAARLTDRFGLKRAEVVPSIADETDGTLGIAQAGAAEMHRWLRREKPMVMAVGTGRSLKAAVDHLPPMDCPQHRIVSLTGNIGIDGSAAYYNVIFSMADTINARHFPFPLPVYVTSAEERALMHRQALISHTLSLAASADVAFVGIGEIGPQAPLFLDGFLDRGDLELLHALGGAGEICGWVYDEAGHLLTTTPNDRTASAPIPSRDTAVVIGLAKGPRKVRAILAALRGRLLNGLITDEATAIALLQQA
ncbi:sugar-binding transcriptional regulator [Halodurantibacterium flavum]|uniref:Sugar-binding transcriptional regulator n=1 Tax=Halodurantibacterium flavum TaxID=1382802 RepID=A0ABW4SA53_9RHOB